MKHVSRSQNKQRNKLYKKKNQKNNCFTFYSTLDNC